MGETFLVKNSSLPCPHVTIIESHSLKFHDYVVDKVNNITKNAKNVAVTPELINYTHDVF